MCVSVEPMCWRLANVHEHIANLCQRVAYVFELAAKSISVYRMCVSV